MGNYVYALQTKIHTIANVTVGVAEFRYKEHSTSHDAERLNTAMYATTCKRRVRHFQNNNLPFFFVVSHEGKFVEGMDLFAMQKDDGGVVGACFDDGAPRKKVGTIVRAGNRWSIKWIGD